MLDFVVWLKNERRLRIALWAIFFGVVCGLSEFGLPAEDGLRAVRNEIAQRSADGTITVVAIDDRTMNSIKGTNPKRSDDAKVINELFAKGAKRVFFDRAYADETSPDQDLLLAETFARHSGRVFLGTFPSGRNDRRDDTVPLPMFEKVSQVRSLWGEAAPFGLSARFPYRSFIAGRHVASLSAEMANLGTETDGFYRPDFSIDYRTIPTISYLDLLSGKEDVRLIAGKDIVFGYTSIAAHDLHTIPFKGEVHGVYFHVIGAQTLKEGLPVDLGWLPPLIIASLFVIILYRRAKIDLRKTIALALAATLAIPIILPMVSVSADVMPAVLTLIIAWSRFELYARRTTNHASGLQTIEQFRRASVPTDHQVFAVKILNYASIKASSKHDVERELIVELSRRIRLSDTAAVVAHDRDTLVWSRPMISHSEIKDHAHGLHAVLSTGVRIAGSILDVAISIGIDISLSGSPAARVDGAMQCAEDAALGGNISKINVQKTAEDREWNAQILSQLERAIEGGELWVAYQPKISMHSNERTGAEALIRWNHPQRGAIEPNAFIPIAERHNRMEQLTTFVLDQAMATLRVASTFDPHFKMAVNLSTQMLRSDRIVRIVERALAQHRVQPGQLVIEITETAPIETDTDALAILAQLKALGVKLSIDDFGTGNATLEYLVKIPADEVKIDRMFITDLLESPSKQQLARSIIAMTHSLGRTVVAEGVETRAVADELIRMGCDEAQGYFYDKALSATDLLTRLRKRRAA